MFKSDMGTLKGKKKRELDKNIGEELLKSKHKIFYKGCPAPFSQVWWKTRYLQVMPLILELKGASRLSKVGMLTVCVLSETPTTNQMYFLCEFGISHSTANLGDS